MKTRGAENGKAAKPPIAMIAVLFVLLVTIIFAGAYKSYQFFADKLIENEQNYLQNLVESKAVQITALLAERHGDANLFVTRPSVWGALSGAGLGAASLSKVITDMRDVYGYRRVLVVDTALRVAAPSSDVGLDAVELSALRGAVETRDQVLVDLHLAANGAVVFGVAHPIFANGDGNGLVVGAVYLEQDVEKYLFPLLEIRRKVSKSEEVVLARRDGNDIVFLSKSLFKPDAAPLSIHLPIGGTPTLAERMLVGGEQGLLTGRDYRHVEVIGFSQLVPGTPWGLVAKVDRSDFDVPAMELGVGIFVLVFTLLLLLAGILLLYWRWKSSDMTIAERQNFKAILDAMNDGVYIVNQDYDIQFVNLEVEKAFGPPAGRKCFAYFHERSEPCPWCKNPKVFSGKSVHWEWTSPKVNRTYDLFDAPYVNGDGTISKIEFFHDITAIREAEERFRCVINESPYPILLYADDGQVVLVNKIWTEISGYSLADIPTFEAWIDLAFEEGKRLGRAGSGEYAITTLAGERRIWDFSSALDGHLPDGRRLILCMAVDVTERKTFDDRLLAANQRLAEQAQSLEAINAELKQFAYVASHDLRAPLRMVTGYLGLIVRKLGPDIDGEMQQFIDYAVGGAKRMDAMIIALLDYSRTGRSGNEVEPLPLADIVEEALLNLHMVIEDVGAEVDVANDLPTVMGEQIEMVRLFQNLIGNAVKYHPPERAPKVSVGWREDDFEWVVWVKDNGIGISPNNLERIFGVFQRLVAQEQYEGSGIGLAICKKIAEHHGGRIWVESVPGEGSTFLVTFPIMGRSRGSCPPPPRSCSKMRSGWTQ